MSYIFRKLVCHHAVSCYITFTCFMSLYVLPSAKENKNKNGIKWLHLTNMLTTNIISLVVSCTRGSF